VKRITAEELPMGDDEMGDESGMDYEIEMGDDEELGSDDSDMVGDEAPVDGGEEEVSDVKQLMNQLKTKKEEERNRRSY
jgi:hypothetical protein